MATWDGSYSGSDDPNYYVYSEQNVAPPSAENWAYYSGNVNDAYLRTGHEYYLQNEPVYQQNCPAYYQVNASASPVPTSNLVPLASNYHERIIPNNTDSTRVPNSLEYFPSSANTPRGYMPNQSRNGSYERRPAKSNNKRTYPKESSNAHPDIAEQSNLHATANEFVPNGTKFEKESNRPERVDAVSLVDNQDSYNENGGIAAGSLDTMSMYDKGRQDKRQDGKKSTTYRNREGQYGQFQKGNVYKNTHKSQGTKNYTRFQGERYVNNRQRGDNSREGSLGIERRKSSANKANTPEVIDGQENVLTMRNIEDDASSGSNVDPERSRNVQNYVGDDEVSAQRDNAQQPNRGRKYNNRPKEFAGQNPSARQTQSFFKNNRKYQGNGRYERYENEYRENRYNYREQSATPENYGRESKQDGYREKDRSKNIGSESKERAIENWRSRRETSEKSTTPRRGQSKKYTIDDDASQRERLTDQLNKGQLECLVCCENIKQNDYVWSCTNCYHVLHLKCVKQWAKSSQGENGWRCPACQNVSLTVPEDYFCFCGKTRVPEWNRRDVAHSCGETCGRTLSKNHCAHKCTLLCHPGSCPLCIAMVTKHCGCGKTSQTLQCSTHTLLLCDSVCGKELNCGRHTCEKNCHHGECGRCENKVEQVCYCGKNKREVTCQSDVQFVYSCESVCAKLLSCGNHTCEKLCHPEDCEPCALTPDKITTCCCGQTPLTEERKSCLDPVPTCDKVCSKNLKCGQPNNPHTCKAKCHEGDCPGCDLTTDVKCRCGNMDRELACKDLTTKADDARCEKRCTKKRSCGKHKCNQLCCIDIEHVCPLPCSKTLSCGRHKCELSCHKGRCQPCWRSSFDELYCECGAAVTYPPVPCGSRRPVCDRPCSRQHPCGHEVLHNCHSEPTCPPCTVLTQRWCHGKHVLRKSVACYVSEISCGLPCSKPLSCGRHKCITICHSGPCEKPRQQCTQPCTNPREMCGHNCAAPCHEGKCPDTPCKEMVKVTCQCGHRMMSRVCAENAREYQRIASSILASKMADMQLGHSIDLEEVFGQGAKKQNQLKTLECNDECKVIERNRRLALGLQIVNPDLSGKLMPRYSDFMKDWAKRDPHFCQMVHEKLSELVQLAKTSKQKSRSYSFDSMNRDKRHFIHESCEHFGCESQAYDQEPKRNVVATAVKDKCWLPAYSLLEIVQRGNGQRKVPGPMLTTTKANASVKTVLSLPVRKSQSQKAATPSSSKTAEPEIDYFDFQG